MKVTIDNAIRALPDDERADVLLRVCAAAQQLIAEAVGADAIANATEAAAQIEAAAAELIAPATHTDAVH